MYIINRREGYLDRVRSYTETPDDSLGFEAEDTEDTFGFCEDEAPEDTIRDLRRQVDLLQTQVKCLKRMVLLNVFESKRDFLDFFADIW